MDNIGSSVQTISYMYTIYTHNLMHSLKHVHMHTCAHTVEALDTSQPSPSLTPPSTSFCKQSETRKSELESLTQAEVECVVL